MAFSSKLDTYFQKITEFEKLESDIQREQADRKHLLTELSLEQEQIQQVERVLTELQGGLDEAAAGVSLQDVQAGAEEQQLIVQGDLKMLQHIEQYNELCSEYEQVENKLGLLAEEETLNRERQEEHRRINQDAEAYFHLVDKLEDGEEREAALNNIVEKAHEETMYAHLSTLKKRPSILLRFNRLLQDLKMEAGDRVPDPWNGEQLGAIPPEPVQSIVIEQLQENANERLNDIEQLLHLMNTNKEKAGDNQSLVERWKSDILKSGKPLLIGGMILVALAATFGAMWALLSGLLYVLLIALYILPIAVLIFLFIRAGWIAGVVGAVVSGLLSWWIIGIIKNYEWIDRSWRRAKNTFSSLSDFFTSPLFWIGALVVVVLMIGWLGLLRARRNRQYYQAKEQCIGAIASLTQEDTFLRVLRSDYAIRNLLEETVQYELQSAYELNPALHPQHQGMDSSQLELEAAEGSDTKLLRISKVIRYDAELIDERQRTIIIPTGLAKEQEFALTKRMTQLKADIQAQVQMVDTAVYEQLQLLIRSKQVKKLSAAAVMKREVASSHQQLSRLKEDNLQNRSNCQTKMAEADKQLQEEQLKCEKQLDAVLSMEVYPFHQNGRLPEVITLGLKKELSGGLPRKHDDFWLLPVPEERPILFVYDQKGLNLQLGRDNVADGAKMMLDKFIRLIADSYTRAVPAYLLDQTLFVSAKASDHDKYKAYNKELTYSYSIEGRSEKGVINEPYLFNYVKSYQLQEAGSRKSLSTLIKEVDGDFNKFRKVLKAENLKHKIVYAIWEHAEDEYFKTLQTAATTSSVHLYAFIDEGLYSNLKDDKRLHNFSKVYRLDIGQPSELRLVNGEHQELMIKVDPDFKIVSIMDGEKDATIQRYEFTTLFSRMSAHELGGEMRSE
ncbi:ABC transporter permease [Paenibacillus odorifer]|uniref:Uncharacterized protein n=1 Tax=Paenibacillus odorifer TaxID=189426 RepID=A0A1R0Y9H8_9BACL|nr:ABC transporter permease [Paenibacillus odorifer]OMD44055.1 hypothetical protein BSK52_00450 [Paenibacillus odorifer]